MRRYLLISAVLAGALGALGYRWAAPAARPVLASVIKSVPSRPPPTVTSTDAVDVFQKAFWKRPSAEDQILHAERREWKDRRGVSQWQWFLVVRASAGLLHHLKDNNAFNLQPAKAVSSIAGAPGWFSFDEAGVSTLQSGDGAMRVMFDTTSPVVYATAQGGGFRAGTTQSFSQSPSSSAHTGRLPTTAPPRPEP